MSVYFAAVAPRYIKIGFSRNPQRRVRRLFSSATSRTAPVDASRRLADRTLLATIPGGHAYEAACHKALEDFAVGGEFFVDEPLVRDFIVNAQAGYIAPVKRPGGPVQTSHIAPQELAQLREALAGMFRT